MAKPTTALKSRQSISEQAQAKIVNPEDRANLPAVVEVKSRLPMPAGIEVDSRQWRVLVETTFPNARTPEAVMMAFDYCRARGLDIFKKPVHIVPMWNSTLGREVETVWPGINEVQITAARTGAWAGMDEPKWGPDVTRKFKGSRKVDGKWENNIEVEFTFPQWCSITVYRIVGGVRAPFTEPVYWLEAYSRAGGKNSELPTDMWVKRPHGQLHKVAKAAGLRAAFPEEGEYTAEEMEGKIIDVGGVPIPVTDVEKPRVPSPSDNTVIEGEIIPPKKSAVPSPSTAKPTETAKQEPEKAKRLTPHELIPDENSKTFPSWASRYIAAIANANDPDELHQWRVANKNNLAKLSKNEENYARVTGAEEQMVDNLKASKPKETAADEGMDDAPQGTLTEQSKEKMPDPEADPENAITWINKKMLTFKDYPALEDWWNETVAAHEAKFFPPDFSDLLSTMRKIEQKLSP